MCGVLQPPRSLADNSSQNNSSCGTMISVHYFGFLGSNVWLTIATKNTEQETSSFVREGQQQQVLLSRVDLPFYWCSNDKTTPLGPNGLILRFARRPVSGDRSAFRYPDVVPTSNTGNRARSHQRLTTCRIKRGKSTIDLYCQYLDVMIIHSTHPCMPPRYNYLRPF